MGMGIVMQYDSLVSMSGCFLLMVLHMLIQSLHSPLHFGWLTTLNTTELNRGFVGPVWTDSLFGILAFNHVVLFLFSVMHPSVANL
jgi:hypothetical protein